MKELLPLALLAACTPEYEEQCPEETQILEVACDHADVVGQNENLELKEAVARFRECTNNAYKITCSDDGWTNILAITER